MQTRHHRATVRRRSWRTTAIVLISLALHGLALAALGLTRPDLSVVSVRPSAPTLYLDIEPRPRLKDERVRAPRPQPVGDPHTLPVAEHRRALPEPSPPLPVPRRVTPPPPGAPPPPTDGPATPAQDPGLAAAIGRTLGRGVGNCVRLARTPTERARCDQAFGASAEGASPVRGSGDRQRDRVFSAEGDRALRQYDARRRPLAGGAGITGPADCAGSNFGTGCAGAHLDPSLAPDSRTNIRSPRDGDRSTSTPLTPGTAVPRE